MDCRNTGAGEATAMKVVVITYIPSPYQVELFNAIAQHGAIELTVIYLQPTAPTPIAREWQPPALTHAHYFFSAAQDAAAYDWTDAANLVVFNYYQHPLPLALMQRRCLQATPWCFWGERPGYRRLGSLGRVYRQWKLAMLHRHPVPIWGMGAWAVQGYQREFGCDRPYINLPYFSDLSRFHRDQASDRQPNSTHFLYSGALIDRKGVDLLASAFSQLADDFPGVRLSWIGDGHLHSRLYQQLARYGDRVQFLGFQPWADLPRFYHAADVLCVPSRHDGWALVVPEGLASGLPVISTDRTGAALELIRHQDNGWLIPANQAAALYQAMKQAVLLSNPAYIACARAAQMSVARHALSCGVDWFVHAVHQTVALQS